MKAITSFVLVLLASISYAQVCTIDYSNNTPGVYPASMSNGAIGSIFSEEITILFPTQDGGVNYSSFKIASVELPLGLTWECSNEISDCVYDPTQDPYACLLIYGTPAESGQFVVNIEADAIQTDNSESVYSLQTSIEIEVTSSSNGVFSFTPAIDCETAEVVFTVLNPITYTPITGQTTGVFHEWDFGNGEISSLENPSNQIYNGSGEYVVSYSQIIDTVGFRLEEVVINSVDCSDIIGYGEPDIYIELYDGSNNMVYTNAATPNDDDLPQTIALNLLLNNPPYSIRVMDDDSDNLTGTAPDNCVDNGGNSTVRTALVLPLETNLGLTTAVGNNGPLNFSYKIRKDTSHVLTTDTIKVFSNPTAPSISADLNAPITLSTTDLGHVYHWNKDNVRTFNLKGATVRPSESGSYTVTAVDENGCYTTSSAEVIDLSSLEEFDGFTFVIYPNPAYQIVNISLVEMLTNAEVMITDLAGRTLLQHSIVNQNFVSLDISNFSNGVYTIVVLNDNGQVSTNKLIVQQ